MISKIYIFPLLIDSRILYQARKIYFFDSLYFFRRENLNENVSFFYKI